MHRRTVKSVKHMGAPVAQLGRFIALLNGKCKVLFSFAFSLLPVQFNRTDSLMGGLFVFDLIGVFLFLKNT